MQLMELGEAAMSVERSTSGHEAVPGNDGNNEPRTVANHLSEVSPEIVAEILNPLLREDKTKLEHASAFWALFEIANKLHTTTAELGQLRESAGKHKVLSAQFVSLQTSEQQVRGERDRFAVEAQYLRERFRELQADARAGITMRERNKWLERKLAEEQAKRGARQKTGWLAKLLGRTTE